jgi:hypothetical protein
MLQLYWNQNVRTTECKVEQAACLFPGLTFCSMIRFSRAELDIKAANVARVCLNKAKGTDLRVKTDEGLFHLAL